VNQYISQKNWAIAGVMTYGGVEGTQPKYSVPTYVSQSSQEVVNAYKKANNATQKQTNGSIDTYKNLNNEYEIVVNQNGDETLASAFQNAWKNVFSKNGRIGNIGGTFYSMPASKERKYEYTDYVNIKEEGFVRNVVVTDLNGNGKNNLWYEYLPESTINASKGSVPVIVLLHGNGNDPRTQFETSGFARVAKENGIILIEPEWQGTLLKGKFEAMTTTDSSTEDNDIIKMIEKVKEKYPQIDASRIYVEGLSRGGLNSLGLGLTQSKIFAAVGVHSAGARNTEETNTLDSLQGFVDKNKDLIDMPLYITVGDKDHNPFVPFYGEKADLSVYNAVKLYGELNDIQIPDINELNSKYNEYFGMNLRNYGSISNDGSCEIVGGVLTNDKGVSISLNVVKEWGHWNYEANAQLMWNFFKQYKRDLSTFDIVQEENDVTTETSQLQNHTNINTGDTTNIYTYVFLLFLSLTLGVLLKKKKFIKIRKML
ncbi:MAG: prolyl oligopeptidase family serine peptidase, partial [Faecalibacillus sp.]